MIVVAISLLAVCWGCLTFLVQAPPSMGTPAGLIYCSKTFGMLLIPIGIASLFLGKANIAQNQFDSLKVVLRLSMLGMFTASLSFTFFALEPLGFSIPFSVTIVFGAIVMAYKMIEESKIKPNCCPHCGYNLTGNQSGICPECGNPICIKTNSV